MCFYFLISNCLQGEIQTNDLHFMRCDSQPIELLIGVIVCFFFFGNEYCCLMKIYNVSFT
jgi:hypothetical protein